MFVSMVVPWQEQYLSLAFRDDADVYEERHLMFDLKKLRGPDRRDGMAELMMMFLPEISFWKQKRDGETQAPVRFGNGFVRVILYAESKLDRLITDLQKLTHLPNKRHGPLMRLPIVSGLRNEGEGRECFGGVTHERLKKRSVHILAAVL